MRTRAFGILTGLIVVVFFSAASLMAADVNVGVGRHREISVPGLDAGGRIDLVGKEHVNVVYIGPGRLKVEGLSEGTGSISVGTRYGYKYYTVSVFLNNPEDAREELVELLGDIEPPLRFRIVGDKLIASGSIRSVQDKLKFDRVMDMYPDVVDMVTASEVMVDVSVTLVEVDVDRASEVKFLDMDAPSATVSLDGQLPIRPSGSHVIDMTWSVSAGVLDAVGALVESGNAKIVASPRVVTINRQQATLSSGGEIPYQVPGVEGGPSGVEYKRYGIQLDVVPELRSGGEIILDLHLESSEPTKTVDMNTPVTSRGVDMKVAVPQGNSLVVAGLFSTVSSGGTRTGCLFPLFGTASRKRHKEIMVVVTPDAPREPKLGYDDFEMIKGSDVKRDK